jgi:hypothetical protein
MPFSTWYDEIYNSSFMAGILAIEEGNEEAKVKGRLS